LIGNGPQALGAHVLGVFVGQPASAGVAVQKVTVQAMELAPGGVIARPADALQQSLTRGFHCAALFVVPFGNQAILQTPAYILFSFPKESQFRGRLEGVVDAVMPVRIRL